MKHQILSFLPGDHPWQNQIYWFDSVESTNTMAKQMAAQGAPNGTVLIAGHQSGGRGRLGRSFQSPAGAGVYMSVILRFPCRPDNLMHLTCATAVAACRAVKNVAGIKPGIKWTNDLVVQEKKIAGILTELVLLPNETAAIIGIGVNCTQMQMDFPEELRTMAASLTMVTGKKIAPAKVAAELICQLACMSLELMTNRDSYMEFYRRNCITLGRHISLCRSDEVRHGDALDVMNDGSLLVRFDDGHTEAVSSGEVSIRGMYGYV